MMESGACSGYSASIVIAFAGCLPFPDKRRKFARRAARLAAFSSQSGSEKGLALANEPGGWHENVIWHRGGIVGSGYRFVFHPTPAKRDRKSTRLNSSHVE